jgi:hypothetical protein
MSGAFRNFQDLSGNKESWINDAHLYTQGIPLSAFPGSTITYVIQTVSHLSVLDVRQGVDCCDPKRPWDRTSVSPTTQDDERPNIIPEKSLPTNY